MTTFPIRVEVTPTSLRLGSGQSGELRVEITNISDVVEHYEVVVVGLPSPEYWRCEPEVPKLRPGESATVTMTITVREGGGLGGGDYALAVLVRSPYQPAVSRAAEFSLRVDTVAGVTLLAQPTTITARTRGSYSLLVRNEGNVTVPVQLEAADEEGKARLTVEPSLLQLRPGEAQPGRVDVRARGKLTGHERRSAITVRAVVNGDQVATAQVSLVQKPRIPTVAFSILGAILAVSVVAGAILVNGLLGRAAAPPPPTAPPVLTASAQGADAPKVQALTVAPTPPMAAAPITITAKVTGTVAQWAWTITDAAGAPVTTSNQPESITVELPDPGTYQIGLVTTGPAGGATTVSQSIKLAAAEVAIRQQTTIVTGLTPGSTQNIRVVCPATMSPLSGGIRVPGGSPATLTLRDSGPGSAADWTIDVDAQSTVDSLEAVVTCVKTPARYTVAAQQLTIKSGTVGAATTVCAPGLAAYGGGAVLVPGSGPRVSMLESRPDNNVGDTFTGWKTAVSNRSGATVVATVSAVCASPAPDYVVQTADLQALSGQDTTGTADCPAAVELLGGGVGAADDSGDQLTDADAIRLTAPVEGAAGWQAQTRHNAQDTGFAMVAYAVCGTPPT